MSLQVTILEGADKGKSFVFNEQTLSIGRGPNVDLEIKDPSISKLHARLEIVGDQVRILDLGSRNGIRVNGKTVNKVKFSSGTIQIGRVAIKIDLDNAHQSSILSENQATEPAELPKTEAEKESLRPQQIVSLVILLVTLVGIFLLGFQDIFWPKAKSINEFYKIKITDDLYQITLPQAHLGTYETNLTTDFFEARMAQNSSRVLVITPLQVGEATIEVPLADQSVMTYTLAIIPDETTGEKIVSIERLNLREKELLISEITATLEQTRPLLEQANLDNHIKAWKNLNWIIEQCRQYRLTPPALLETRRLKTKIEIQLQKEREQLFNNSRNFMSLYSSSQQIQDLDQAIKIAEKILSFTNESNPQWSRIQSYYEQLKTIKRQTQK